MNEEVLKGILDSIPYDLVFVNTDHIIKYLNKAAREKETNEGRNLIGQSIFECHNDKSNKKIKEVFERFQNGENEVFSIVTRHNLRKYITPVRNEKGKLLGYYERFELNEKWS